MFNGTHTVKVKRGRRRLNEIRWNTQRMIRNRQEHERWVNRRMCKLITFASMIQEVLDVPITDDMRPYIDMALVERSGMTRDYVRQALKYLRPDFSIEQLLATCQTKSNEDSVEDWIKVRWGIVRFVDGNDRHGWGVIPSDYYRFDDADFCFTDEVVNTEGHNHTKWKRVIIHQASPIDPYFEEKNVQFPSELAETAVSASAAPAQDASWWRKLFHR